MNERVNEEERCFYYSSYIKLGYAPARVHTLPHLIQPATLRNTGYYLCIMRKAY